MADYITDAELLAFGIAADALAAIPEATRDAHRVSASSVVASYLAKRYALPLVSWSDDIKQATANVAAWTLLCLRGFNPTNGRDMAIKVRRDESIAWLESVVRGDVEPEDVEASGDPNYQRGPLVESDERQSWEYPAGNTTTWWGDF